MNSTVGDMILAQVAKYSPRLVGETAHYTLPFDLTQSGMSMTLGKGRAHIAMELKKLMANGLVNEQLSHIKGTNGKRRKAYTVTDAGLKEVDAHAKLAVEQVDHDERMKITIAEMQTELEVMEHKISNIRSNLYALNIKVSA
jgi:DNA-binding transcriptional regulator GbsR (MarR family)